MTSALPFAQQKAVFVLPSGHFTSKRKTLEAPLAAFLLIPAPIESIGRGVISQANCHPCERGGTGVQRQGTGDCGDLHRDVQGPPAHINYRRPSRCQVLALSSQLEASLDNHEKNFPLKVKTTCFSFLLAPMSFGTDGIQPLFHKNHNGASSMMLSSTLPAQSAA